MHRRPGGANGSPRAQDSPDTPSFLLESGEFDAYNLWKSAKSTLRVLRRFFCTTRIGAILLILFLVVLGVCFWLPDGKPRSGAFLGKDRTSNDVSSVTGDVVGGDQGLSAITGLTPTEELSDVGVEIAKEDPVPLVELPKASRSEQPLNAEVPSPSPPTATPTVGVPKSGSAVDLVRGVAPGLQSSYAAQREKSRFECFDGSQTFSNFDVVNDDYCDCLDGSDEPGTSACAGVTGMGSSATQGFSCGWQSDSSARAKLKQIRLASVNDGICDCCGGEDEYEAVVVCPNRCSDEVAAEQAEISQGLAGSRAREVYVEEAAKLVREGRYSQFDSGGPDNVFFAEAARGCMKKEDGEFTFEVCLFDSVKQHGKPGQQWTIGKKGEWSTHLWEDGKTYRKDFSKLIMDNGDYCQASRAPRRAEIYFQCGATSSLISVQEAQICVYEFHVKTPAACQPLHPYDLEKAH